jgi:hypothetical protein
MRIRNKIIIGAIALFTLAVATAVSHNVGNLLTQGTTTFFVGTGDTAVTYAYDDAYSTNRMYTLIGATATNTIPLSTNTAGRILPTFSAPIDVLPDANGIAGLNTAISVSITSAAAYTNVGVDLHFARSVDGTNWDKSNGAQFSFTASSSGITVTNFPSTFLVGTKRIRLWKVVSGANPTDNGIFRIDSLKIGQWVP